MGDYEWTPCIYETLAKRVSVVQAQEEHIEFFATIAAAALASGLIKSFDELPAIVKALAESTKIT